MSEKEMTQSSSSSVTTSTTTITKKITEIKEKIKELKEEVVDLKKDSENNINEARRAVRLNLQKIEKEWTETKNQNPDFASSKFDPNTTKELMEEQ